MTLEPGQPLPKSLQKTNEEEEEEALVARRSPSQTQNEMLLPEDLPSFSQPPAPPPQQPLPEKPELSHLLSSDVPVQSVKRSDTEKPSSPSKSPESLEPTNGQILSLVEALKAVTEESDLQVDRIKHLELALRRERKARELAERRANALSGGRFPAADTMESDTEEDDTFEPPLDSIELMHQDPLPNGHLTADEEEGVLRASASVETLRNVEEARQRTEEVNASTARLQARLDLMVKEMDEMKNMMEVYKNRAEEAEEGRRTLAEMVENIRAGRDPQGFSQDPQSEGVSHTANEDGSRSSSVKNAAQALSNGSYNFWTSPAKRQIPNGHASSAVMHQELERTFSAVLQQQRGPSTDYGRMTQSAPYISMVGVVIIGVGIMTWLNGWQPGGEK